MGCIYSLGDATDRKRVLTVWEMLGRGRVLDGGGSRRRDGGGRKGKKEEVFGRVGREHSRKGDSKVCKAGCLWTIFQVELQGAGAQAGKLLCYRSPKGTKLENPHSHSRGDLWLSFLYPRPQFPLLRNKARFGLFPHKPQNASY